MTQYHISWHVSEIESMTPYKNQFFDSYKNGVMMDAFTLAEVKHTADKIIESDVRLYHFIGKWENWKPIYRLPEYNISGCLRETEYVWRHTAGIKYELIVAAIRIRWSIIK